MKKVNNNARSCLFVCFLKRAPNEREKLLDDLDSNNILDLDNGSNWTEGVSKTPFTVGQKVNKNERVLRYLLLRSYSSSSSFSVEIINDDDDQEKKTTGVTGA